MLNSRVQLTIQESDDIENGVAVFYRKNNTLYTGLYLDLDNEKVKSLMLFNENNQEGELFIHFNEDSNVISFRDSRAKQNALDFIWDNSNVVLCNGGGENEDDCNQAKDLLDIWIEKFRELDYEKQVRNFRKQQKVSNFDLYQPPS